MILPFKERKEAPKNFWTWLNKRMKMHKKGHKDTVIVVCGEEQSGKSRWTLRTEWCLYKENWIKEGKINVDRIIFNGEDYRYQVTHNTCSIVHDDEAITHFYSRKAMSEENVKCNETLAQCGFKHNLQFILIPNFFVLDSYIKEHRVHAIVKICANDHFRVWTFYKIDGTENKKKLNKILKYKNFAVNPSSEGYWLESENTKQFNEFVKAYRNKENYFKTKSGEKREIAKEKLKTEYEIKLETAIKARKELGLTQIDAAKIAGVTRQTLAKKEKEIVNMSI